MVLDMEGLGIIFWKCASAPILSGLARWESIRQRRSHALPTATAGVK